jgi:L-threonylcarbamoyladenylate synthase
MTTLTTDVDLAVKKLEQGEVVALPTETVYGLAADATNDTAIKKIFFIKNRPLNHPLIMHICHDWDLSHWISTIPEYAQAMIRAFWPGPLTLVLNIKKNTVSTLVNAGQNSIAIRAPKHDLTQQILRKLNRPLVAPSANPFGQISPTTALHVAASFPHENFLILDGGRCNVGIESTIIQATDEHGYAVLRPGTLDLEQFSAPRLSNLSVPNVPGQLESHYKPHKKLYYLKPSQHLKQDQNLLDGKIYTLSFSQQTPPEKKLHHQFPHDVPIVAYQPYNELRLADQSKADIIVIELPPDEVKWSAIREKIMKAGQPIPTH